jgi:hypothetical protein
MPVARVRSFSADCDTTLRSAGDRFYCVFDTDMAGLPHHADILATMPRSHDARKRKQAWRAERPLIFVCQGSPRADREIVVAQPDPVTARQR